MNAPNDETKELMDLAKINDLDKAATAYSILMHPSPKMPTFREYTKSDFKRGAKWEATRHNSKAENLYQTLLAFRNIIGNLPKVITPGIEESLLSTLRLVDQCLIENKPDIL